MNAVGTTGLGGGPFGLALPPLDRLEDLPVMRIRAGETNKFVLLVDPVAHGTAFLQAIEIFDVGGCTPPNVHRQSDECFVVLHGAGEALCGADRLSLGAGSRLLVPAGVPHRIFNTGTGRLYCLTTLVPDDELGGLIRNGVPDRLDADDLQILTGTRDHPTLAA
jgi:mannose-6-phosphate isomerase-like protein (cupin superfamily)